ncbi:hypothetical protein VNO78_02424 [Psophocarpus tetragonolobus]|uniref:Uncharacterized protein n=1 Tax=Psophocarpus tetragonolobus TaxID=3891 RepID=A0AAN9XUR0_PSOTE
MRCSSLTRMSSPPPILVLTLVLTTTVSVLAVPTATIEHCLRLKLNPPAPPPHPRAAAFDLRRIVCKDIFRAVTHSLHATATLPLDYLVALCNIFHHSDQNVERYVTRVFRPYDVHQFLSGHSCASIPNHRHAKPSSSFSTL